MKPWKRLTAGALSLILALSLLAGGLPAAYAADAGTPSGSIGLTLRFDLPQTAANAAGRDIQLEVRGTGGTARIALPSGLALENSLGASVSAAAKNTDGVILTNESRVGYYEVELSGLPAGGSRYDLTLTGTGYKPFRQTVTLNGYSQHVIAGTGDATFSLGDVNGDGAVDSGDLAALDARLGKTAQPGPYDLNGDGKIDVTDLAYVNHTRNATGQAQVLDTAAILSPAVDVPDGLLQGDPADLFRDGGSVTIVPSGEAVQLPITLDGGRGVELSQIRVTCPDGVGQGGVEKGTALVELTDGSTLTLPFNAAAPAGVYAIGEVEGQRVVTIDLGRKVAVKKVTIQVTSTTNETGFATVTKIEFLKDIVPDTPVNDADRVKGLTVTPGDGSVALSWNAVHNVTGYTVAYGPNAGSLTQSVTVNRNSAAVTGLDNLKTYYFQVTAVNGDWQGAPSRVVSAMPQPNGVPGAPSNIGLTEADQSLRLTWGSTKDASFYQVFYRPAGQSAFQQFGGNITGTSATITGLVNGTTYEVAVKAGNQRGTGPYSATASGTPNQEALVMPDLPQEGRISSSMVQSVVMENPNNVNRSLCPSFKTEHVIDNDAATYWVANQWWVSSKFTYTFKEPQDMNYAILVPYLGGSHKYALKTYVITAKNSAGDIVAEGTYSARSMDPNKNYLVLTFPMAKGVKELSISLNEREGNGCRVSVSEMAFYKSDTLPDQIAALFADGSFTALRAGVTQASIDALSARLEAKADFYLDLARLRDELSLASALLSGNASALGLVQSSFQSRNASKDAAYGQSASDLQPLGVTARAGSTVAVYASLPGDAPVYVVPTQFFGESGIWRGTPVKLENGRNYIYVPKIGSLSDERGGPLYLTYAGNNPGAVKVQVRLAQNAFAMPVLELSGWYTMNESARREAIRAYVTGLQSYVAALKLSKPGTDIRNATEISTPSVLLSLPADRVLAGLSGIGASVDEMADAMYQNVLAWEDVLYVANQVQGIIPAAGARTDAYRYPMTTRQNIRYMRMSAGSHIGVGYGSTQALACGRPVSQTGTGNTNSLFGWGIAHEIGHNMDKLGKAEITNNIYALAVQAWDGGSMIRDTRLTLSNIWPAIYEKTAQGVYDKTSAGRPGSAGNVFVQLGMYWQLHLAYDSAAKPLDFFNRFFTAWKAGKHSGYTYDERVALIASETAGRDLTQFFTRWGLILGDGAKAAMAKLPAETRALWYLNDGSYAYRLQNGRAFGGTISASASVSQNHATVTISGGNDTVLGYEILRNGKPIGFTTGNAYVDDLGAANNLTYSYSVAAVDKLGNRSAAVSAGEVRVAYDKTISPSLYTLSRNGAEVEITMNSGAVSVTGLKVGGGSLSGCTVSARLEGSGDWTPVALGPDNGGTAYFAKPGAPGDSRIWTYDVAALRISGLPAGASVELLDYPGDRIDFYEGASVGRLSQPLAYDGGVVPAGTVVVVGTYRGDPVYNTLEIQARYNTTAEAQEENGVTSTERPMNGFALFYADIPADGAVSDTSDGFWVFVPDWEAEEALNAQTGVTASDPTEFRAVLYRTDDPYSSASRRVTSETLWTSFPKTDTLPQLVLTGQGVQ